MFCPVAVSGLVYAGIEAGGGYLTKLLQGNRRFISGKLHKMVSAAIREDRSLQRASIRLRQSVPALIQELALRPSLTRACVMFLSSEVLETWQSLQIEYGAIHPYAACHTGS